MEVDNLLQNVIKEKIAESKTENLSISICFDGSSSIKVNDFQYAQQGCCNIVSSFHTSTSFHISQFSAMCVEECSWSKDKLHVMSKIQQIRQMRQGTNTADALEKSKNFFLLAPPGKKMLFLITDGMPDDQNLAVQKANELKMISGVEIYGIGVGNISFERLQQISGTNTFILQNFTSFLHQMYFQSKPTVVPDSELILNFRHIDKNKFKDSLRFEMNINNIGDASIVERSKIIITGGLFYQKKVIRLDHEIRTNEEKNMEIELKVTGNASIDTLPDLIDIEILHPDSQLPYFSTSGGFYIQLRNITLDLVEWKPPSDRVEKANIIVFGITGAGKSTLINNMIKLWLKSYEDHAPTGNSVGHVTLKTEFHEFNSNARFRFLDTKGLSGDNYMFSEFDSILDGTLKEGYLVESVDEKDFSEKFKKLNTHMSFEEKEERMAHAIIFVAPQGIRHGVSSELDKAKMNKFRENVTEANRRGLTPLLAVTNIDQVDESEFQEIKKKFSSLSGIIEKNIFLVDNRSDDDKIRGREKIFYQILRSCLDNSEKLIKKIKEKDQKSSLTPEKSNQSITSQSSISTKSSHNQSSDFGNGDSFSRKKEKNLSPSPPQYSPLTLPSSNPASSNPASSNPASSSSCITLEEFKSYDTFSICEYFEERGLKLTDPQRELLEEEEIDGAALVSLSIDHLKQLGFKMGTASKIFGLIPK